MPVAREIVVGDEELVDALRPIEAHEMFDVVGRAEARFAALDVDDRAERALIRTAAAGVEARAAGRACAPHRAWEGRRGRPLHARQILHEVVNGRETAVGRVAAAPDRAGPRIRPRKSRRPNPCRRRDRRPGRPTWPGTPTHGSRRSRRVFPPPRGVARYPGLWGIGSTGRRRGHKAEIAVALETRYRSPRIDARICLVDRFDVDDDVRPKGLALGAIGGNAVQGGERIRGYDRAPPPDDVSLVVVVRRFDKKELEAPLCSRRGVRHDTSPMSVARRRRCAEPRGFSNGMFRRRGRDRKFRRNPAGHCDLKTVEGSLRVGNGISGRHAALPRPTKRAAEAALSAQH